MDIDRIRKLMVNPRCTREDETIETLTRYFSEKVPFTYIADGHHRAASAAKVRKELGAAASRLEIDHHERDMRKRR